MAALLILGSGAQARYVIDNVRQRDSYQIVGIADLERQENIGALIDSVPVVCTAGNLSQHFGPSTVRLIIAYGKNHRKQELAQEFGRAGYRFASIISSQAYVAETAVIEEGVIINPLAVVLAGARIGEHSILHSHVVVEHDCIIKPYANIGPGATLAGNVSIGTGAYVYTGACVIPKVRVGNWSVVGAGSVVIRDVPDGATVAGVPAKLLADRGADR